MEFSLKNSILRPWKIEDASSLAFHANNPKVAENLRDGFPHPYRLSDAEFWISKISNSSNALILAIVVNKEAVGTIGVHLQNDVYRKNGEMGYWLAEPYWNHGIMTEVVGVITKYAFENYDIHRIYSGVFEHNIGSMRVLEKNNFIHEAVHRKSVIKNNRILDEHLFARCIL